jgi:NAD(P)-dependent dehydrogenase (short-subunit alcohol dehydrogenase family)
MLSIDHHRINKWKETRVPAEFTSTADEILDGKDLTGRQVVVTGATAGLGLATARAFARAGADVVLIGRDETKLAQVRALVNEDGKGLVTAEHVDLADLRSVAAGAQKLRTNLERLDVLVLNAGVMASPLERSPQGHEMQLAVSHLGHHLLTTAVIDLLIESTGRVVALSSSAHQLGPFNFDDPDCTAREYDRWAAYAQAKTATALFALEIARRYGPKGVVTVAVHPGVIKTELQRHLSPTEESEILAMSADRGQLRSVDAGAASIVWAAVADEAAASNGGYVANCAVANESRAPHASATGDAKRLWDLTETMVSDFR